MKLYIKNMVSLRCKLLVAEELNMLEMSYLSIDLGMIELKEDITIEQRELLQKALSRSGLELMEDKNAILVEKIKNTIIEMVHYSDEYVKYKFSNYLSEKLGYDYAYMASLFSSVKGITIEKYIILNKIEHVKELLLYDELSLKEMSFKMHYSSVAHLCTQFKKVTGLTPTYFKQLARHRTRIAIEDL
jgi:YesN/AraC family two-component response regulator